MVSTLSMLADTFNGSTTSMRTCDRLFPPILDMPSSSRCVNSVPRLSSSTISSLLYRILCSFVRPRKNAHVGTDPATSTIPLSAHPLGLSNKKWVLPMPQTFLSAVGCISFNAAKSFPTPTPSRPFLAASSLRSRISKNTGNHEMKCGYCM